MRVGNKMKTMYNVKGFQVHMQREKETPNANPLLTSENEILIGSPNIYEDVSAYLQGVKKRANNIIARDMVLTASPSFFKPLTSLDKRDWIEINKKWLQDYFKDNCIYSVLHKDETTWHIHSLIVPKLINKKGKYALSNNHYFDGVDKLRALQDSYAQTMQERFKQLNRGNKYSKAKHLDIKQFYALINQDLNENDIKSLCAKAKNSELLELKMKGILKTLDAYKKHNRIAEDVKEELIKDNMKQSKELNKTKEEKEVYKQVINLLSKHYDINADKIKNYINYAELNKSNEKVR